MTLDIILLIVGLLLVVFGSDYLVDGASDIARRSGISEFVIGLTIVGIGTSTPEMVVSFISAFQGSSDMSVGNVIGSNIFNTFLILGVTAIILPMTITPSCIKRDIPVNILASVLLIVLGTNKTIFGLGSNCVSRIDGLILIICFALYMYASFKNGRDQEEVEQDENQDEVRHFDNVIIPVLLIVGGLAALIGGGKMFVNHACSIAQRLGWSEKFIAITILAGGTSLPELATCIAAAIKKKGQLALGNILGSNISNICLILGGSALIHPLSMENITITDMGFLLLASLFLLVADFTYDRRKLDRAEGVALVLFECIYMFLLIKAL